MNILLLEDGPFLQDLKGWLNDVIGRAFPNSKCEVTLICSPSEALEVIKSSTKGTFDFVVSDGTKWKDAYTAAIKKFGREKVVVYSGDPNIVWRLKDDFVVDAYIKGREDRDEWKTMSGLAKVVAQKLRDLAPKS